MTNIVLRGKMSNFGGPNDHGVSPSEDLALYDQPISNIPNLFLPNQPKGTSGTARRLNDQEYYIACRWDYSQTPKAYLIKTQVIVKNVSGNYYNGRSFLAWPVDWGPNENTGRIADLSPGLCTALGLSTDNFVEVTIPLPAQVNVINPLVASNPIGKTLLVEKA